MAERKQAPANQPVEPQTRRGRRKMDDVYVGTAASKAKFDEQQRQAAQKRRSKTAALSEQEKQDALLAKRRAARWKRHKDNGASALRALMVVGPITAPMAIAWTGQSGFATGVLGWTFIASLLYAAAYELTTVFAAWMYHEAKKDGDKGWEYRVATWFFAAGAGIQQWWHYSDNWHATARSVTYSSMTAIGVMVWELYARLIHRRKLRKDGKLPGARPRIGLARWVRYPHVSWVAWSLSVRYSFDNFNDMWTKAELEIERKKADRDRQADLRRKLKAANARISELTDPKAGPRLPAQPTSPDPKPAAPDPGPATRLERMGPTGSERTSPDLGQLNPGPTPERKAIEAGPLPPNPGPLPPNPGPENGDEFVPTDLERKAIDELNRRNTRINRGSAADMVRELVADLGPEAAGQSGINTKRAAQLAAWGRENSGNTNLRAVGE